LFNYRYTCIPFLNRAVEKKNMTAPVAPWKSDERLDEIKKVMGENAEQFEKEGSGMIKTEYALMFPKIGSWGDASFPYPKAPYEELKAALLKGGNRGVFGSVISAACNLVARAWAEGRCKRVLIVGEDKFDRQWVSRSLEEDLLKLDMDDVNRYACEVVMGPERRFVCYIHDGQPTMRTVGPHDLTIFLDRVSTYAMQDVVIPQKLLNPNGEVYLIAIKKDDEATKKRMEGLNHVNHTMSMYHTLYMEKI
jgi:hypothetical protein